MDYDEKAGQTTPDADVGSDGTEEDLERGDFDMVDSERSGDADNAEETKGGEENAAKGVRVKQFPAATGEQLRFIQRDVADFVARHPGFGPDELSALENNSRFRLFCGTRFGREPLSELYEDYVSVVGSAGKAAVSKAERRAARSTGGGSAAGGALTPAQRDVLNEWNAEHPEMKMTAKEFLRR